MEPSALDVNALLPHRGRMKLIDTIVSADTESAVTRTTVDSRWPLITKKRISPLMLIELVAQTAAVIYGVDALLSENGSANRRGWLVGVKRVRFGVDALYPGDEVIVQAEDRYKFETFREVAGIVQINGRQAADILLQCMQAEEDSA
jgi:predicted hotdog family 3-hydroxylacyl-ACP dehydratase